MNERGSHPTNELAEIRLSILEEKTLIRKYPMGLRIGG